MSTAFWQLYPYAVYLGCGLFTCCILAAFFSRHHTQHVHGRWLLPISPHAGQYASIGAELSQQDQHSVPLHLYAWDARQDNLGMVATLPGLGEKESRVVWPMFFPKRGIIALPPLEIECEIPFGIVRSRMISSAICNVIILPSLGTVKKDFNISLESFLMQHQQSNALGSDELMRLRPYQHGDSQRLVHWRASARSQQLIVGLRSHMSDLHINLAVNCQTARINSRRFERLISMAATLVNHAYQQGWSITLFGPFAPSNGLHGSRQKLMEALACLNADQLNDSNHVHQYIPEHQHCIILSLDHELEKKNHGLYYSLPELEDLITLARERR
ncbi:MAG: DUF58 domain-containing protein [Planctomycetes bacterium]|nr:DUF58 domain-containing protein [Planctomycetota bacterium]